MTTTTNEITYSRVVADGFAIVTAHCYLPLYGRWVAFDLSAYCDGNRKTVAMTFGLAPIRDDARLRDPFLALRDGVLWQAKGDAGNRHEYSQVIAIRSCHGRVLNWTGIGEEPVHAARELSRVVLKKFASVVETQRTIIRKEFGSQVRDQTLATIVSRYGAKTDNCLETILGEINWSFMLHASNCSDRFLTVVNASMIAQLPEWYGLDFEGDTGIELLRSDEVDRFRGRTVADAKAASLLKHVCGDELAAEFASDNQITMYENGYTFILAPGRFLKCIDPDGKRAELCIHTVSFMCNTIDELSVGFLHIRHRFDEFMNMAVVHSPDHGFSKHKREKTVA